MRYIPITRNNDFQRAYARGKSYVHPLVVVYVNRNRAHCTRVGLTATKKVGNAVLRNRSRRVVRAAMAQVLPAQVGNVDIVVVARTSTAHCKSDRLVPVLQDIFKQAGLLP